MWPPREAWPAAVGGLLTGHPAAGLSTGDAARLPGTAAVYAGVAVAELAALGLLTAGGVGWARYRRPGDARGGMATRGEAAAVLGLGRLLAARSVIRPDRYGPTEGAR